MEIMLREALYIRICSEHNYAFLNGKLKVDDSSLKCVISDRTFYKIYFFFSNKYRLNRHIVKVSCSMYYTCRCRGQEYSSVHLFVVGYLHFVEIGTQTLTCECNVFPFNFTVCLGRS